ncbi:MAG: insulinase family protein [Caulobacteraceae bacterium]|nr:insulinase family protein [Caulobacteraceae bacterium]
MIALFAVTGPVWADEPAAKPPQPVPAQDNNTLHADPAVIQGILPNGLRYAILRNATPKGTVSLRLAIGTGSFDETAVEHGAAHFVEHMAFSAGKNAHEAGPEHAFAAAGVAFGRDQNADTGLFATRYRLDLPQNDAPSLDLAFDWLRAAADGTTFEADAVDRERGIILAERAAGRSPLTLAQAASYQFEAPELRSMAGEPIGSLESLKALNGKTLRDFYERWYRPDNAVLVVVGDADPQAIRQRIEQSFSSWTAKGPTPARQPRRAPDEKRGEAVLALSDPSLPSLVQVCRLRAGPPDRQDDVARLRGRLESEMWISLLNRRLDDVGRGPKAPFLGARLETTTEPREARRTCLMIAPLGEDWQGAIEAAEAELTRFAAHGPTDAELDDEILAKRAVRRGNMMSAATRPSQDLATPIADALLDKAVVTSPAEDLWAFDAAVEFMTPQTIQAAFVRDWSGSGPLLTVMSPKAPPADLVRAAWDRASALPPGPQSPDSQALRWAYSDFGRAGRVKSRQVIPGPNFTRITFANGVALSFKHTGFIQGEVKVVVSFGAGRRNIANSDVAAAQFGSVLFSAAGLGRHDHGDLQKLFAQTSWGAKLVIGDDTFQLQGETRAAGLRSQLQILAAYMSDPGFRPTLDARIPTAVSTGYRLSAANPASAINNALNEAIAPGGPLSLPPEATLAALRTKDFERILKPSITGSPLRIIIVGDVDEASATEYVAETFGALPPRQSAPAPRADTWFLRFPDHDLPLIRTTHAGAPDKAMIGAFWPLYVATPSRRREELTLMLLAKIFDNELRHRVRQELGKAYNPTVGTRTPDEADQGYIYALIETSPEEADSLLAETRRIAERLARGEFTDEALETARKPMLTLLGAQRTNNDWLAGWLDAASRNEAYLGEMQGMEPMLASITPAEVRQVAATWLKRAPIVVIASPKPGAAKAPAS